MDVSRLKFLASAILALFLFVVLSVTAFSRPTAAADVTFTTEPLVIETAGGARHQFTVELALQSAQRQQGLMYRKEMAPDAGMLFDFEAPREVTMWMRNTLIPLDMLFIDAKGRITHIHEGAVPLSETVVSSRGPVDFVLELNAGEVKRRSIRVGDRVRSAQIGNAP
ncbi:DUF192 domain-containing protein [Allorhizobium pseudoryzae]|uniref:DUF192 domain-containing protein n=1 Tax=Allorhizobium pseudoryzae TaxID=379684 RepID=UPI003D03BEED